MQWRKHFPKLKRCLLIPSIHQNRINDAIYIHPRIVRDGISLESVSFDCQLQTNGICSSTTPIDESVCTGFAENLNSESTDDFYILVHYNCIHKCADSDPIRQVPACSRNCVRDRLPWIPDWAFSYEARAVREIERGTGSEIVATISDGGAR